MKNESFQVSRVLFPLKCDITEAERNLNIMYAKDWRIMKTSIDDINHQEYNVEKKENRNEVTQRIYIPNSDLDILIKYNLIKGKWYLVYYKRIML